jgi:hypothetical protein
LRGSGDNRLVTGKYLKKGEKKTLEMKTSLSANPYKEQIKSSSSVLLHLLMIFSTS